jgi:hypothetical protein
MPYIVEPSAVNAICSAHSLFPAGVCCEKATERVDRVDETPIVNILGVKSSARCWVMVWVTNCRILRGKSGYARILLCVLNAYKPVLTDTLGYTAFVFEDRWGHRAPSSSMHISTYVALMFLRSIELANLADNI